MSFADFLENELLDHVFGNAAYTAPGTLYVGLSTTTPADDGTNITEPSGGAYARVSSTNNLTNWPAAAGGSKSNGVPVTFAAATASWGTVTHFFLADAPTGGNILGSAALAASKLIDINDQASFDTGQLTITLD